MNTEDGSCECGHPWAAHRGDGVCLHCGCHAALAPAMCVCGHRSRVHAPRSGLCHGVDCQCEAFRVVERVIPATDLHDAAAAEAPAATCADCPVPWPEAHAEAVLAERERWEKGLAAKLAEVELHDDTGHGYDDGYMDAWRDLAAWLDEMTGAGE